MATASPAAAAPSATTAAKDTQNLAWQESKSGSVAYKLMKKMGWSEGKGLGKDEAGMASHIKVVRRDGTLGLGASKDVDGSAGWSSTTTTFSAVLASLNAAYQPPKQKKGKGKKRRREGKGGGSASGSEAEPRGISGAEVCPSRARRVRAKDIRTFSSHELKAILGHGVGATDAAAAASPAVVVAEAEADASPAAVVEEGSDCSVSSEVKRKRRKTEGGEERSSGISKGKKKDKKAKRRKGSSAAAAGATVAETAQS